MKITRRWLPPVAVMLVGVAITVTWWRLPTAR